MITLQDLEGTGKVIKFLTKPRFNGNIGFIIRERNKGIKQKIVCGV